MTTHEVAKWFDGLRNWLGDALNKSAAKSLSEISEAFRDLPEKPFKDFVKDIKSFQVEGVAPFIEEIRAFQNGQGEGVDKILARINKLKKPELTEVLTAFALPTKRTIDENKMLLRKYIEKPNGSDLNSNGATKVISVSSEDVENGYRDYCQMKDSLSSLTIQDLRTRFESFHRFSKPVLEAIAQRLGYRFLGSKDKVISQLLETLERMKISQFRGEIIGSL